MKFKEWFDNQKAKAEIACDKALEAGKKGINWMKDHPGESAVIAAAGVKSAKMVKNIVADVHEKHWQETHYYDQGLGQYIQLKRPLSQKEKKWVQDQHSAGRGTYYEIYRSRDLIK